MAENDVEIVERGEEVPFDGRLIRHSAFNMMWAYIQELEKDKKSCREYKKQQEQLNDRCLRNLDRAIGDLEDEERRQNSFDWMAFGTGTGLGMMVGVFVGVFAGIHISGG